MSARTDKRTGGPGAKWTLEGEYVTCRSPRGDLQVIATVRKVRRVGEQAANGALLAAAPEVFDVLVKILRDPSTALTLENRRIVEELCGRLMGEEPW